MWRRTTERYHATDRVANKFAHTHEHVHAIPDSDQHGDRDGDRHSNGDTNADEHSHPDEHPHGDRHSNGDFDENEHRQHNADQHRHIVHLADDGFNQYRDAVADRVTRRWPHSTGSRDRYAFTFHDYDCNSDCYRDRNEYGITGTVGHSFSNCHQHVIALCHRDRDEATSRGFDSRTDARTISYASGNRSTHADAKSDRRGGRGSGRRFAEYRYLGASKRRRHPGVAAIDCGGRRIGDVGLRAVEAEPKGVVARWSEVSSELAGQVKRTDRSLHVLAEMIVAVPIETATRLTASKARWRRRREAGSEL